MDEKFINQQAELLRARLAELQARVAFEEGERQSLAAAEVQAELEEQSERDRDMNRVGRLSEQSYQEMAAVTQALRRIALGTYGVCDVCGQEISEARLRALPTAQLCIEDAEAAER